MWGNDFGGEGKYNFWQNGKCGEMRVRSGNAGQSIFPLISSSRGPIVRWEYFPLFLDPKLRRGNQGEKVGYITLHFPIVFIPLHSPRHIPPHSRTAFPDIAHEEDFLSFPSWPFPVISRRAFPIISLGECSSAAGVPRSACSIALYWVKRPR